MSVVAVKKKGQIKQLICYKKQFKRNSHETVQIQALLCF